MKEMKWKIADVASFFKNSFFAILKGEFLLRMNAGRYLIHIIYTFFLLGMVIWISLSIETTMSKVEKNKSTLEELQIAYSQKTFDIASLTRRSSVEARLKTLGSVVAEPQNPATIIGK